MMPKPLADIKPNTLEFEILPLVKPTGFREYDARWWFNGIGKEKAPELNFTGVQALGLGMATLFHELGVEPKVVTGHDFRSIDRRFQATGEWRNLQDVAGLVRSRSHLTPAG